MFLSGLYLLNVIPLSKEKLANFFHSMKKIGSKTNGPGKTAIHMQQMKTRPISFIVYKIKSIWTKDLGVKTETMILLKDKICKTLNDIHTDKYF